MKTKLFLLAVFCATSAVAATRVWGDPHVESMGQMVKVECCAPALRIKTTYQIDPQPQDLRKSGSIVFHSDAHAYVDQGNLVLEFPPGTMLPAGGFTVDTTGPIVDAAVARKLSIRIDDLRSGRYMSTPSPQARGAVVVKIPLRK